MSIARVTAKGQVTIPADVRKSLGIQQGDDLVFEMTPSRGLHLRLLKRARLSDLFGSLPATHSYPGKEAVRAEMARQLARKSDQEVPE
jgi:antitoxin PrlF